MRSLLFVAAAAIFIIGPAASSTTASQSLHQKLARVTAAFHDFFVVPDVLETFEPSAYVDETYTDPRTNLTLTPTPGQLLNVERKYTLCTR